MTQTLQFTRPQLPPVTSEEILAKADCCVKCGLCLPACPTYRKTADEAESPRGRIALIQAVTSNQIDYTPRLQKHLDRCLMCRACETSCPSGVAFGEIMDSAREQRFNQLNLMRRLTIRFKLDLPVISSTRRFSAAALAIYQRIGLQNLMQAIRFLGIRALTRMDAMLPPLNAVTRKPFVPDEESLSKTRVALFTGCVSEIFERDVLDATVAVCSKLGVDVSIPAAQACCGALHRHAGARSKADEFASKNLSVFSKDQYDDLVCIASACAGELRERQELGDRVTEITRYLSNLKWPSGLELAPLYARIAVHEPCSHRNILSDTSSIYSLLTKIPDAHVEPLANNEFCCGAAGLYMLNQPEMSDTLLADKIRAIRSQAPRFLVTTNTGCALQIEAGIRRAELDAEVVHPVELIFRQML